MGHLEIRFGNYSYEIITKLKNCNLLLDFVIYFVPFFETSLAGTVALSPLSMLLYDDNKD